MTLRLILMRHAKSDWSTPASGDFDRPLNDRGRKSAARMGEWLTENGYEPETVLVSAAARTRETWGLVSEKMTVHPNVEFLENLYLASPESMFQMLRSVPGSPNLMMVAHNPGSAIVASALAETAHPHVQFDQYPTAATAIMDFGIDQWADLLPETGTVVDFAVPRDLLLDGQ